MNTPLQLLSALVVTTVVVSAAGPAAAQTTTARPDPGTSTTTTTTTSRGITQCPAVHMLLAPGTSETSRFAEPNSDTHGFLSQHLVRPVMAAVNGGNIGDLSSGFAALLDLPPGVQSLAGTAGEAIGRSMQGPNRQAARVSRTYVTYPATVGGAQPPGMRHLPENFGDTTPYAESMNTGVEMTEDLMAMVAAKCPETKVFLAGFSQGAEVISNVARRTGAGQSVIDPDQVAGVALFADPTRAGGTPLHPDGASSVGPVPGTAGENVLRAITGLETLPTANAGGLGTDNTGHVGFGQLSDRVVSWCLPGDYVCGLPVESKLVADIVPLLETMSLGDPVAALEQLARILDRAVSVGNLSEIADFSFGGTGFSLRPSAANPTPVLNKRVQAATEETTSSPTSRSEAPLTSTATTVADSAVPEEAPAALPAPEPIVEVTPAPAGAIGPPAPMPPGIPGIPGIPGLPGLPPLPTPEQFVGTVVEVAAGIGGMALGAAITVARKTITPENLAQIAVAGVTGGPQAAGAVAVARLSDSAMSLLEPGTASGYARQTLQILKDAGVPVPEQVELAVSLAAWLSTNEHNAYGERPVLPDGRSPATATRDWVQAIAADVTADSADPLAPAPRQTQVGLSALDSVEFNRDAARAALNKVGHTTVSTSLAAKPASTTTPTSSAAPTSTTLEGN